jgi:hypothetical protein
LSEVLQKGGLDETVWLPHFAKIGVASLSELHHREGDMGTLSALQERIKSPEEKELLQELLKIKSKQELKRQEVKKRREKAAQEAKEKGKKEKKEVRDDVEKNIEEAKQLFQELERMQTAGKDRQNKAVQEIEKRLREILCVTPNFLVSSDKTLEELIAALETHFEKSSTALQVCSELDDVALLQKVSYGRALQGVLVTSNHSDQKKERACLLRVPEKVSLTGACSLKEDTVTFSSKGQEDNYRATVNVLGHGVTASAQVPVYGAVVVSTAMSESEEERTVKDKMYSSTVQCCSINMATCNFGSKDLILSDNAKEDLKKIIKVLKTASKENIQRACESFFRMYGSHVNQGSLQFGGNFCWTCSSRNFDIEETEVVKKLQSEAIRASSEVSLDIIKRKYAAKCSKTTLANTQLSLEFDGGPTEVSSLPVWKAGLMTNNCTWILTDRGSKLVAVWDVIGRNHEKELGEIKDVLRKAWEEMTGLKSEPDFTENLEYNSEDVLRKVSEWSGSELTIREIEDNLAFLLKVKEDILRKMEDSQYWVEEYLRQEALQEFLLLVVEDSFSTGHVKFLMQQIVEEKNLMKLTMHTFPDIEHISKWLYTKSHQPPSLAEVCKDFESFSTYLDKTIGEVKQQSPGSVFSCSISIATNVSLAINSLLSNCTGTYDEILIKILAFPFQIDDGGDVMSLKPLSLRDLESLLEKFTEVREQYNAAVTAKVSTLRIQSLLILWAIRDYNVLQEGRFKLHLKIICQMMEVLELRLDTSLKDKLKSYYCGFYGFLQLKESLESLLADGSISLLHLMCTVVAEKSTSQLEHAIPMLQNNPDAHALFLSLGLKEHYHKKLTLQDAICIRPEPLEMSLKMSSPTKPSQLPFLVLQKLMSFDCKCRSDLMKDGRNAKPKTSDVSTKIHPLDNLLGLIICSDYFLQQDLFSRLARCQIAVPFILPDPFTKELLLPLWAMRSITKEWKCLQTVLGDDSIVEHTSPIIKYPMPIVSFLRLGKQQKRGESKSRILNKVISDSDHFFHRDLPGGSFKHVLGDGLVDMTWYLPGGKRDDTFPDAVTFLNLHGDARSHPVQSRFLSQISSMCFVLLAEEDLEINEHTLKTLEQFSSSAGGIVLLKDTDEVPETLLPFVASIDLQDLNAAEITDEIQNLIRVNLFDKRRPTRTIEEFCVAPGNGIHIVEGAEVFKRGLEQANKVTSLVQEGESIKHGAKEEMLPLQGDDLWRKWGNFNKELHRQENSGKENAHEYAQEMEVRKASVRSEQCRYVEALTPVMEVFIRSLLTLEDKTARTFFLQHLILNLSSLSGERISGLLTQYQAVQEEISELQNTTASTPESKVKARKENAERLEECRKNIQELKDAIVSASFGLHHLLRELGQVYEAASEEPSKYGDQLSRLPQVAAELLFDGYPLELMDGDAAHVPVKWVRAVMNEVNKKLDNPSMFVLSVLGLQSTGKSTMLNTVFGLTFNTSAGRCTRGAFMQLLPLDETIEATTGYSYVLVIDTEGLRTPELDSSQTRKHDNELATFIIGLANVTFINISGEVAGDLDEILQTTVHAFLRMNKVKHDPSCQFIHQNSGASTKGQVGQDSFAKQLDKWTHDAAMEENCVGKYEKFSDVIQFDDQKDVHHFPGLWKGDPPMAPVNQGYSQAAQRMKFNLLQKLQREIKSTNVSSFQRKISDLWGALIRENFVFSFRNTEEIIAYNLLGAKFNIWEGEILTKMLDWEKKAANEINTEKQIERIPEVVKEKRREISSVAQEIYKLQKDKMDQFFAEDKLKSTLVQWKVKFELKLEAVRMEWETHADNHCKQLGSGRHAISQFEQDRIQYTALINSEVQKFFGAMKKEQDDLNESLERRKLNSAQLKKIMERKHTLFTPQKMSEFGIVLTQQECSALTEQDVARILVGGELTSEKAKAFLEQGRHNEEEMKAEFDKLWTKWTLGLPRVYNEQIDVEASVERRLITFSAKLSDSLKNELKNKKLRDWGKSLTEGFVVVKKWHYTVKQSSSWIGRFGHWMHKKLFQPITDLHQIEAQKITDNLFDEAVEYLESTKKSRTDYNDAYTHDLLYKLKKSIEEKSSANAEHFSFTRQYRIEIFLAACGYAVAQFEDMAKAFRLQNDPREHLEEYEREPLFTRFKNQYRQTAAEVAIADNLCAALFAPIKGQIEGAVGAKIVGQMKSASFLSNKMALKAKILIDLGTEGDFEKYMTYFRDVKRSLKYWIERYTIEYCNEKDSEGTKLQALAKKEVSRIILFLGRKVTEVKDDIASKWLSTFCEDVEVRREVGVPLETGNLLPDKGVQPLDLKNFKAQMESELSKLEKKLHGVFNDVVCDMSKMHKWQESPYNLLKKICGCTEQCPFCGEQCDLGEHTGTDVKHTVKQHRPQCVIGWHLSTTEVLALEICPIDVDSNTTFQYGNDVYPYRLYHNKFPDWHIPPDPSATDSEYWMWFVSKNIDSIAAHFGLNAPTISPKWRAITWERAKAKAITCKCFRL